MDIEQIDSCLKDLAHLLREKLPDAANETLTDLLRVREYKVATEILCDLLSEQDIHISEDIFDKIVRAGQSLGIDSSYWQGIQRT